MIAALRDYFATLARDFGRGWNRFWFTPRDPLVLSVLRVATGLLALWLVAGYSYDLQTFFGPRGLLPLETLEALAGQTGETTVEQSAVRQSLPPGALESMPRTWRFSYLDYAKTSSDLWGAHAAGLVVLGLFTVGLWTRVTSVLALMVVLSYMHRGPMLVSQAEPVLAFIMFYLCLGPAGRDLSLDGWLTARRRKIAPTAAGTVDVGVPSLSANIALRLIQVHVAVLYAMMALGKLSSDVWWNGAAVWWLITRTESRLVDLTWLHDNQYLVNAWTHAIVLIEVGFVLLVWHRLARPLVLVLSTLMWILLIPITGLVPFSMTMLAANLAFIPPSTLRDWLACCVRPQRAAEGTAP